MQAGVDHIESGIAQAAGHDLDAAVVAVEADLGDQDANGLSGGSMAEGFTRRKAAPESAVPAGRRDSSLAGWNAALDACENPEIQSKSGLGVHLIPKQATALPMRRFSSFLPLAIAIAGSAGARLGGPTMANPGAAGG